jgi:predicted site-specific integrase-resolvase
VTNTNGHGPRTAVLYARVSTEEQAKSGYSIAEQLRELRSYAAREGYRSLRRLSTTGIAVPTRTGPVSVAL